MVERKREGAEESVEIAKGRRELGRVRGVGVDGLAGMGMAKVRRRQRRRAMLDFRRWRWR